MSFFPPNVSVLNMYRNVQIYFMFMLLRGGYILCYFIINGFEMKLCTAYSKHVFIINKKTKNKIQQNIAVYIVFLDLFQGTSDGNILELYWRLFDSAETAKLYI